MKIKIFDFRRRTIVAKYQTIQHGFTLVELLIAMTLFAILGIMLVRISRGISDNWRTAESQRKLQETAEHIFSYLQEDLQSLYCPENNLQEMQFVADNDQYQRPQIRFIRKFGLTKYVALQEAGKVAVSAGYNQYFYGVPATNQKLRSSNGLAEVVYFVNPTTNKEKELLRGFRTPLGGVGTFADVRNLQSPSFISQTCQPLCNNLLYFGIRGWTNQTTSWKLTGSKGPISQWTTHLEITNKIQIQLLLYGDHTPQAELVEPLLSSQDTAIILEVNNFPIPTQIPHIIKIDDELITYKEYEEGRLVTLNRGQLGTKPQNHKKDAVVRWGQFFYTTILLPDGYNDWYH